MDYFFILPLKILKLNMVLCLMVGCGNKSGKNAKKKGKKGIFFSRIPLVVTTQGESFEELTKTRRRLWISAISHEDITESKLNTNRVCSKHFVSGKAAKDWDRFNVDWVPTHKLRSPSEVNKERFERRRRRQEVIDKEIEAKLQKISDPGETVQNIF